MLTVALVSILAAVVSAENVHPHEVYVKAFYDHMQKFKLTFKDGAEFVHRVQVFADNYDLIEKHNADPSQTFKMGHNQFSHLTFSEFQDKVRIGGVNPPFLRRQPSSTVHEEPASTESLPSEIDWVVKGAVTDVKDQGNCGSCWSFSTTGSLEGAYYLKYGSLKAFSEQELVSCDTSTNAGCNGGWMDDAFEFIKKNGGLTTEDQYPYTSGTTGTSGTCKKTGYTDDAKATVSSYTDVKQGSVSAMMSAVAQQPVSIAIQANQLAFQFYSSGVLTGKCGNRLDHGVLAVGYGTWTDGTDYWKVKNSWSDSWGMDGYILIERSDADLCGVLDAASYPTL